ncbi:MAG: hypothetical protein ACYS30_20580 [Planctomycetota bacterium]|jgi:hypothetical protein
MKSLIRTISVIIVLGLATGCLAKAKDRTERRVREADRAAQEERDRAAQEEERQLRELNRARELQDLLIAQDVHLGGALATSSQYGAGRVLVIPTKELNAKELLTITEDLNIMSQILDKQLHDADLGRDYDWFHTSNFLEWNIPVTKCIYLQEHGVLFMKKVNFPLSPPVEPNAIEKIKEDFDPVWEQTRQQMYLRKDFFRKKRKRRRREGYNPHKVETLKNTLLKTLRHTANIRNLTDDDWVIITVIGESSDSCGHLSDDERKVDRHLREVVILKTRSRDRDRVDTVETRVEPPSATGGYFAYLGQSSPTVMTIRVRKAVVDALHKGEMDFDEFRQKVQIFTY